MSKKSFQRACTEGDRKTLGEFCSKYKIEESTLDIGMFLAAEHQQRGINNELILRFPNYFRRKDPCVYYDWVYGVDWTLDFSGPDQEIIEAFGGIMEPDIIRKIITYL